MGISSPVHLIFIAAVALVVLGPKRLPELARALGRAVQEFRDAMSPEAASGEQSFHDAPQNAPAPHLPTTDPGMASGTHADDQAPS
ncbi:MAG TPA: twin-arginine translocase TatA/TatE family subunit [Solirubrobacteraceae bacterium]